MEDDRVVVNILCIACNTAFVSALPTRLLYALRTPFWSYVCCNSTVFVSAFSSQLLSPLWTPASRGGISFGRSVIARIEDDRVGDHMCVVMAQHL
jgi:hypothetical protein